MVARSVPKGSLGAGRCQDRARMTAKDFLRGDFGAIWPILGAMLTQLVAKWQPKASKMQAQIS